MNKKNVTVSIAAVIFVLVLAVIFMWVGGVFSEQGPESSETTTITTTENGTAFTTADSVSQNSKNTQTTITKHSRQTKKGQTNATGKKTQPGKELDKIYKISSYTGTPYAFVNDNVPYFTKKDYTTKSYETYASLDYLKRCGVCMACIGKDLFPTETRGNISSVHPSGWQSVTYPFVDGGSLYNRCHLIGFQLAGENANAQNLITGTRYLNTEGMLPFENLVHDYVEETGHHVLYRVTPIFEGDNLVANGVLMEGYSVEDNGEAVCFNVFCYNVQPGVTIFYKDGHSQATGESVTKANAKNYTYVGNKNSHKFHLSGCKNAGSISEKNCYCSNDRKEMIAAGYQPSGCCNP